MKDKDLQQLISSLKTEAIEAAEEEAQRIVTTARQQAKAIEEEAADKQQQILSEAEREAQAIIEKGKQALQQAARDLKLSLRQEILAMLNTVLEAEVAKNLKPDLIRSVITPILKNVGSDVEIELPAESLQDLRDYLQQQLQSGEYDLKFSSNGMLPEGMKIRKTQEGWIYEISPKTITEALRPHLTPQWTDLLADS